MGVTGTYGDWYAGLWLLIAAGLLVSLGSLVPWGRLVHRPRRWPAHRPARTVRAARDGQDVSV